jgi:chemotaxis protein methyltransferase CheR
MMAFTYFFRDLQTLEIICEKILPDLKTREKINIWDAGCAMGPEPYTLAMLIRERTGYMYFRNINIIASDIDVSDNFGDIIKNGVYPKEMVERIPSKYRNTYFEKQSTDQKFQLIEDIRKRVNFLRHDLLTLKPVAKDLSLILCKNVLLHFSEKEQIEVMKMFHGALLEGGCFATEQTQKLPESLAGYFEPVVPNAKIYKKLSR